MNSDFPIQQVVMNLIINAAESVFVGSEPGKGTSFRALFPVLAVSGI